MIYRKVSSMIDDLFRQIRDQDRARWEEEDATLAINRVLDTWSDRVYVDYAYTISGGLVAETYAYTLPDYIPPQLVRPQWQDTNGVWWDVAGYEIVDGQSFVLSSYMPVNVAARVLWYGPQGRVPADGQTLNAGITSSDTSLVLADVPDIGTAGFVDIGGEIIGYTGYTKTASLTTLTNLVRGVGGTTAASHSSGDSVDWCIAAPTAELYNVLMDLSIAYMHIYRMVDSPTQETQHHNFMMRWSQDRADRYWSSYAPLNRAQRMQIGIHHMELIGQ